MHLNIICWLGKHGEVCLESVIITMISWIANKDIRISQLIYDRFFEYTERILWRYLYTISAGRYSCTQWSLGKGVLSTVVKAGTIESEDLWKIQSSYRKLLRSERGVSSILSLPFDLASILSGENGVMWLQGDCACYPST